MVSTQSRGGPQSSPNTKGTSTITDRHGSRSIKLQKPVVDAAVPAVADGKAATASSSKNASTTKKDQVSAAMEANPILSTNGAADNVVKAPVNRKKQKRRLKQAARAAEQQISQHDLADAEYAGEHPHHHHHHHQHYHDHSHDHGHDHSHESHAHPPRHRHHHPHLSNPAYAAAANSLPGPIPGQFEPPLRPEDYDYYSDEEEDERQGYYRNPNVLNGHAGNMLDSGAAKKKNKKKKKAVVGPSSSASAAAVAAAAAAYMPPPETSSGQTNGFKKDDQIWNTSTQEEKKRIKEFWLSLREEDRRSLVKVEKDAVLRKMKEQQKHSCSCNICGRKRTAIEEELEVLYDAYYNELEHYANHQQQNRTNPPPMTLTEQGWAPQRPQIANRYPPHPRDLERPPEEYPEDLEEDEEDEEDDEDDEDDDADFSEEEYSEDDLQPPRTGAQADFFNFGNSLTVQGGILTVADDLLKNDGKKFIEMMEQLAERRVARENDPHAMAPFGNHQQMGPPSGHNHLAHNHGPGLCSPEEEEYEDEEDEDDEGPYDEEDDYEDDDETVGCSHRNVSNQQDTMTEEQRMEEGRRMFQIFAARMFEQRVLAAYREKVAQERQQRLLEELEEESRADLQKEQKKAKEAAKKKDKKLKQKQAKEEERAKREAEKAAEEAAAKAAEERKAEEQRQRREEAKRKKEAEKKAAEEERVRKEAAKQKRLLEEKTKAAELDRKQKEQKELDKKRKEDAKKKEKEDRHKERPIVEEERPLVKKEVKDKSPRKAEKETKPRKNSQSGQRPAAVVPTPQPPIIIAKRPTTSQSNSQQTLQTAQASLNFSSPHLPVATPVIPKAPAQARPRKASTQGSVTSSPSVSQVNPGTGQNSSPVVNHVVPLAAPPGISMPPRHVSTSQGPPMHAIAPPGVTMPPNSMFPMAPAGFPGQGFAPPPIGSQFRGFPPPGVVAPGQPVRPGPGRFIDSFSSFPQPMAGHPFPPPGIDPLMSQMHTRQSSGSFDTAPIGLPSQAFSRPAPIQRPTSPGRGVAFGTAEVDNLTSQLGSSALLDDALEDDVFPTHALPTRRESHTSTSHLGSRGFGSPFMEPIGPVVSQPNLGGATWGIPASQPFGQPLPVAGGWPSTPGAPLFGSNAFQVARDTPHTVNNRPITARLLICQACSQLHSMDGFHDVKLVLELSNSLRLKTDKEISRQEFDEITETEGNNVNGGGEFRFRNDDKGRTLIKHDTELQQLQQQQQHRLGSTGVLASRMLSPGLQPALAAPGSRMTGP